MQLIASYIIWNRGPWAQLVIFSWEPAPWTPNSQEEEEDDDVKKKPLQFSAINSDFWA